MEYLNSISRNRKTAVITIHKLGAEVLELVDNIIIRKGEVAYSGSKSKIEEVFKNYGIENTKNRSLGFFLIESEKSSTPQIIESFEKMSENLNSKKIGFNTFLYTKKNTSVSQNKINVLTLFKLFKNSLINIPKKN